MNFSNQNDEVVISSSNKKPLMPYAVHTVTLDSVEITESGIYKFLAFSFSNEEGAINLSVFKPNQHIVVLKIFCYICSLNCCDEIKSFV